MKEENKQLKAYYRFQLEWMASHGHTITSLVSGLNALREDYLKGASILQIYDGWEKNLGFGGTKAIWPSFEEFLRTRPKKLEIESSPLRAYGNSALEQGKKQWDAYTRFQLQWMASHGHSIQDMIIGLDILRKDFSKGASILMIYEAWEKNWGFRGAIWPSFEEFLRTEYNEARRETE